MPRHHLWCVLQVESYWDECLALPSKLKDWDAYNAMKSSIQDYRDVFPLLHKLASKVCLLKFTCTIAITPIDFPFLLKRGAFLFMLAVSVVHVTIMG